MIKKIIPFLIFFGVCGQANAHGSCSGTDIEFYVYVISSVLAGLVLLGGPIYVGLKSSSKKARILRVVITLLFSVLVLASAIILNMLALLGCPNLYLISAIHLLVGVVTIVLFRLVLLKID